VCAQEAVETAAGARVLGSSQVSAHTALCIPSGPVVLVVRIHRKVSGETLTQ
jgi:hypothetical protein